uniref:Uncharacterized protein n=1 Tax=Leersia perrieri TaxID=77586 RepID=A0A0D9VHC8_9ORYZ
MCRNFAYSPNKPKPAPKMKGKKGKGKKQIEEPPIKPPLLCDFMEWIDEKMSEENVSMVAQWIKW